MRRRCYYCTGNYLVYRGCEITLLQSMWSVCVSLWSTEASGTWLRKHANASRNGRYLPLSWLLPYGWGVEDCFKAHLVRTVSFSILSSLCLWTSLPRSRSSFSWSLNFLSRPAFNCFRQFRISTFFPSTVIYSDSSIQCIRLVTSSSGRSCKRGFRCFKMMQRSSGVKSRFLICHGHRKRATSSKSRRPNRGVIWPGRFGPRLGGRWVLPVTIELTGGEVSDESTVEADTGSAVLSRLRSVTIRRCESDSDSSTCWAHFRFLAVRRTADTGLQ